MLETPKRMSVKLSFSSATESVSFFIITIGHKAHVYSFFHAQSADPAMVNIYS